MPWPANDADASPSIPSLSWWQLLELILLVPSSLCLYVYLFELFM
jgi:hypothetical protein